jgi:lauroyl/myristoyl acyltransferase
MANWFLRASHAIDRLGQRLPSAGILLAGPAGFWLGPRAGPKRCPDEELVLRVWKDLDAQGVLRVRRQIARTEFRNRVLRRLFETRGPAPALARVRVDAAPLLRLVGAKTPVVLACWHLGPSRANTLALKRLGIPVLFAIYSAPSADDGSALPYFELKSDDFYARFLKAAIDALRSGAVVGMMLDAFLGNRRPLPFLGGTLQVPRGVAALARVSGARVVPVTSRWSEPGAKIQVTFHEPLPLPEIDRKDRDAWEQALMQTALDWFAAHLRAHPEVVRLKELRRYGLSDAG